jgi:2-C-methyl-D-erythritol 4-phosphate cytidylyltransferase
MTPVQLFKKFIGILEASQKDVNAPKVTAIIVAAGRGERMGIEGSKQFLPICDIPMIALTLSAFESSRLVSKVVVVTRSEYIIAVADIVREYGFSKVLRIVKGGETRQQSAASGLKVVDWPVDYLAVHDGARPLITPECIDKVIEAAFENKVTAAAVKLKDTVKIVDDDGFVLSTPDRRNLWAVQTPQVIEAQLYRAALEKAEKEGADYTDDCQLCESMNERVKLVESEYTNIKVTTSDDISVAEAIFRLRGDTF